MHAGENIVLIISSSGNSTDLISYEITSLSLVTWSKLPVPFNSIEIFETV
jgi:hypothetical protein